MENFPFVIFHFSFVIENLRRVSDAMLLPSASCACLLPVMRLDVFLKASRLCSGRTLAQKLCEAGRVSINGTSAKSSHAVKPGDEILIRRHNTLKNIRVVSVPAVRQISRKDAHTLYEVLSEQCLDLADL
jgi:ribosomal 50S subunit-recycling heat shock protein